MKGALSFAKAYDKEQIQVDKKKSYLETSKPRKTALPSHTKDGDNIAFWW